MHRSLPALAVTLVAALSPTSFAAPPTTKVEPVADVVHGERIVDDYRWLEALEADNEDVRAWTTAQNDHTRAVLDAWPGRARLEKRLAQLMTIGSVSAPWMRENRYFYTERTGEQNQAILYLREGADGAPRVLLDPNALDERGLVALDWYVPTDDGRVLAFGLSHAGDEMSVLHLMDVDTGAWRADEIPGKVEFGGWAPGGGAFLYGQLANPDDAYSRVFRWHEVGRHHRADPVLLKQEEPSRIPGATLSRDGRWIIVQQFEGWSKQDVFAADVAAWRRTGTFTQVPIADGIDARFEPQFVRGDDLYMLTTHESPNGRLVAVNLLDPARERWRPILAEDPKAVLGGCAETRDGFVAEYERDATTRLAAFGLDGRPRGPVGLPGLGSASIAASYDRTEAFVSYASYNEPDTIYRVDLATGASAVWARPEVPVDPSMVTVRQEWCTSRDGTRVPMFVVHRTDLVKDPRTPTVIYAYGGFNISMRPAFIATNFPWYEAGGIYVVANLRGGGEYGEAWHRAGMLESKQNVYDDLYAVAEHLVKTGVTTREHLAVMGGSNGGLLTGVAATQRPELWAAVVSAVPLLDMVRFPDFLMAKFWTPEYGDPADAAQFKWLRAYSPYHNVAKGEKYPAILFTAGENDNRVHPMHARKMAALMQSRAANDADKDPILLWVEREAGHGRGKPLHLRIQDSADRWSFIMWQTGMSGGWIAVNLVRPPSEAFGSRIRMSISIERVADLPHSDLAPLVAESTRAGWRFLERLVDEWSTGANRFDRAGEALVIARDAGRLVGVCGLNVDPYAGSPRIGRVRHLYVSADRRGHGIGRLLVQRVLLLARGTFDELRLRTDCPHAARFYEALGFRAVVGVAACTHAADPNDGVLGRRPI